MNLELPDKKIDLDFKNVRDAIELLSSKWAIMDKIELLKSLKIGMLKAHNSVHKKQIASNENIIKKNNDIMKNIIYILCFHFNII